MYVYHRQNFMDIRGRAWGVQQALPRRGCLAALDRTGTRLRSQTS